MKKRWLIGGAAAFFAAGVFAQSYRTELYLRVLNILDVRTSIQNQDSMEPVLIDDDLEVMGVVTVGSCVGCGSGVDTANSPNANEFARFTDADTIEGRTPAELRADVDLEIGTDVQAFSSELNNLINNCTIDNDATPIPDSCVGDGSDAGAVLFASKAGATSRNTNATPTADPDLTLTFPSTGRYEWDIYLVMSDATNGTADFKFDFGTTGTVQGVGTTVMYYWWETAIGASGAMQLNGANVYMGYMGTTLGTDVTIQAISADTRVHLWGVASVSSGATLTFNWAQAVSNGSNVTVAAGSIMYATRLGT